MKYIVLVSACIFIAGDQQAICGAWPRKAGTGFVQLGFSSIGYKKVYGDGGEKIEVGADVRNNVLQGFGDLGVTDNFSVSVMVPFVFLSVKDSGSTYSHSGIGDVALTCRYNVSQGGGYAVSGLLLLGLPTGDSKDPRGLLLGDGEFNAGVGVSVGKSFYPASLYMNGELLYDFRSGGFSNDILYGFEVGYGLLADRLYLIVLLSGRESTSTKPTRVTPASRFGLNTNNQEFTSVVPKAFFRMGKGWSASLAYFTAVHGRNVAGGAVLSAGIAYEY
jgi:hypothetical protein